MSSRLRQEQAASGWSPKELTDALLSSEYYLSVVSYLEPEAVADLAAPALLAAQLGRQSAAAAATSAASLRLASGDPAIGALIRRRDEIAGRLASLEGQRSSAIADGQMERSTEISVQADKARAELDALLARITDEFPDYADLAVYNPLTWEELSGDGGLLGPDEALVAFIQTAPVGGSSEATWLAVVARSSGVSVIRLPVSPAELLESVAALRASLDLTQAEAGRPRAFDLSLAHRLHEGLIAPLRSHLDGIAHLMVVPDGPLQSLPLDVLVTQLPEAGQTGNAAYTAARWLGDDFTLTTLPSMASLRALRRQAGKAKGGRAIFAMADPALKGYGPQLDLSQAIPFGPTSLMNAVISDDGNFRSEAICQQALLPQTRVMGRVLIRALGGSEREDLLLGPAATEAAIYAANARGQLRDSRVLAFNTHGLTAGELKGYGNAEPALLLTPAWDCSANRPPDPVDPANDGLLTASEVATLDLDADWVLLTACNTASGGQLGAEPLSGLARSFFYAGARSLLVSHWYAHAGATELLMEDLFSENNQGSTKAERLQQAQNTLRQNPNYAHPAFWAAFSIVGEAR
jgi:CHAT domain-containing protein